MPAPKALSVGSGEGLRISDLEQSLPVDYPALARDEAFVALLRRIGRPNARKALRAHLLSSPLGTETMIAPPRPPVDKLKMPTVGSDAQDELSIEETNTEPSTNKGSEPAPGSTYS